MGAWVLQKKNEDNEDTLEPRNTQNTRRNELDWEIGRTWINGKKMIGIKIVLIHVSLTFELA
jgi:hypothetical protein